MHTDDFVINLLANLPDRCIEGKKRLQKFAYLLKESGVELDSSFRLWNFGPYSTDLESATDFLTLFGDLQSGTAETAGGYLVNKYCLPKNSGPPNKFSSQTTNLVSQLDKYKTVELEVASTILYFINEGQVLDDAVKSTERIKPSKSTKNIVKAAIEVIEMI